MKFSFLPKGVQDDSPIARETSWADFIEGGFTAHKAVPVPPGPPGETPKEGKAREEVVKLAQPAFSPAIYPQGRKRGNENVEAISMAVADLDHATLDTLSIALNHIQAQGLEALVYSGWSHGLFPGEVSARIIVPFASPVQAHDWPTIWPRAMAALGVPADPACKDPSRLYFLPACPAYRHAQAFTCRIPGKPLDVGHLTTIPLDVTQARLIEGPGRQVARSELATLQKTLARTNALVSNALGAVLDGQEWELREGHKDKTLFQLMSAIAQHIPDIDPRSLLPHFQASFSHFPDPGKEAAKVIDKYERLVDRGLVEEDAKAIASLTDKAARIAKAFRGTRDTAYTSEETQGLDRREWIVQYRTSWYLRVLGRGYVGPFGLHDATPAAHTYLSPSPVRLSEVSLSGDLVDRDIKGLTMEYGSIASNLVLDMTAQEARYDAPTATLIEAPCPRRAITPAYSSAVADWLRLLGGTKADKLEQWLSYAYDLDTPCSALFLEGDPGTGKSLLATGLSYLYTTNGPTSLSQVMGNFNEALAQCPIVFADETAPTDMRGKARTAELREIIQATQRHYTRKNLPAGTLKGACRVIIAANNAKIFEGEDTLTPADIEAITGRILHIKVGPKAGRYLVKEGWTQGQGREEEIAAHVAWLTLHAFKPVSPPRFLVSDAADLARSIATSTTLGSAVAHWLVSALLNRCMRLRAMPQGSAGHLLRVIGGRLYVSPRTLIEAWTIYETNVSKNLATSKRVSAGLAGFSPGPEEVAGGVFYPIRVADLITWAEAHGMCMAEEISNALAALDDAAQAQTTASAETRH